MNENGEAALIIVLKLYIYLNDPIRYEGGGGGYRKFEDMNVLGLVTPSYISYCSSKGIQHTVQ